MEKKDWLKYGEVIKTQKALEDNLLYILNGAKEKKLPF